MIRQGYIAGEIAKAEREIPSKKTGQTEPKFNSCEFYYVDNAILELGEGGRELSYLTNPGI